MKEEPVCLRLESHCDCRLPSIILISTTLKAMGFYLKFWFKCALYQLIRLFEYIMYFVSNRTHVYYGIFFLISGNLRQNWLHVRCYHGSKKIWGPPTKLGGKSTWCWSWGNLIYSLSLISQNFIGTFFDACLSGEAVRGFKFAVIGTVPWILPTAQLEKIPVWK